MRKLIALLLCLALCLPALVIPARAEEEREIFTSGNFQYALLSDGTAEITGITDAVMNCEIPDMLDGHTVTAIGNEAFSWWLGLTSAMIPGSVTSIARTA